MKITGFHNDGGFAHHALVPENSLIPVPSGIPPVKASFAEPVGCVWHALERLRPVKGQRMIIYGGGTLGLIAALMCRSRGAVPLIIEKSAEKTEKIRPFLDLTGIRCLQDTVDSEFDLALNACADQRALSLCVVKLGKGGKLSFFSGLQKNKTIETNLVNLMHYKEVELYGAYGLKRTDMIAALGFIESYVETFETLVESIVPPENASELMPRVLTGHALKYILDFTGNATTCSQSAFSVLPQCTDAGRPAENKAQGPAVNTATSERNRKLLAFLPDRIEPVGDRLRPAVQRKIDEKTKPLGSLGKIEDLAVRMSLIQESMTPRIRHKSLFVFAADHGIAEAGVSAFPAEVTGQMVKNFLDGGAAINVLCRYHQIDIRIVDMGVNTTFENHPDLIRKKIRRGTRNFAIQAAMTAEEAARAVQTGMDVFLCAHARRPIDIIGLGEMGIGNSTSATAIISAAIGISPQAAVGRGTGIDDKGLEHKATTIARALDFHDPDPHDGFDILCKVGGYEIAGIVGATLAAASQRSAIVLDGLISTAAGLIAHLICPAVDGYLISGHKSTETAQMAALRLMGLNPLIDFDMRLGEGTGAALAIDITEAACRIMCEMASFEEAGVSHRF